MLVYTTYSLHLRMQSFARQMNDIYVFENLLAEYNGLFPVDPNPSNAAIFFIVVVACSANSHPQEPTVAQNRAETQPPTGT